MDNKFENRDFEHFLKQNADQYRMFPSEKVWKGINNTLHTRRRWYGIGLALLLLTTAAVTGIMLSPATKKQQLGVSDAGSVLAKKTQLQDQQPDFIIAPAKSVKSRTVSKISPDNTQKNLFANNPDSDSREIEENNSSNSLLIVETDKNIVNKTSELSLLEKPTPAEQTAKPQLKQIAKKPAINVPDNIVFTTNGNIKEAFLTEPVIEKKIIETENTIVQKRDIYPMTIESVMNSYQFKRPSKKLVWQIYLTPSVTYRKLDDNKSFLEAARSSIGASNVYSFTDINSQVTHKPDIGMQLGFTAGYPLTKNITIKAGLQFNVSKYNIRASSHTSEIATIALNTSGGGTNTVSAVTNYRNVGGYRSSWLHNKYVSASVPVGAEFKLSGHRKAVIGIGGTVEPTYVLGNRAYLLSTDLKNYAEVPSLTRKWNINTGFEIFAGYNTGKVDWRIGPQVRYQVFSSFADKYPIKEHLFDFGVKLALTLK